MGNGDSALKSTYPDNQHQSNRLKNLDHSDGDPCTNFKVTAGEAGTLCEDGSASRHYFCNLILTC